MPAPVTVRGGFDTYAGSAHSSREHGDDKYLRVQSGAQYAFVYLKNPAPRGATIVSATLTMRLRGASSGARTDTLRRVSDSWKAARLNWDNKPGVTGSSQPTATLGTQVDGDTVSWDVTTHLQTVVNGSAHYGWRVETTDATGHRFYGFNSGDNKPTLTVQWSDKPSVPTDLAPAGVIGVGKPILQCSYSDVTGDDLVAIKVQVDPSANGSSPAFDSGEVATTEPQLDLTTTAYAGLSNAASTQWRAQVKDSGGLWSDWSDWVTITRTNQGALTIDNPGTSPNNYVSEPTPPIFWTFTGQAAYRVRITDQNDHTKVRWDTGKIKSSANSVTVPEKYQRRRVLKDDTGYSVNVRVWDSTANRVSSPGDPAYVEVWRDFTVNEDATVAAPVLTSVLQVGTTPAVDVTWTDATAPDSFNLCRNTNGAGWHVIVAGIDPADVFVSGTTYTFRDWTADPKKNHVYAVRAVRTASPHNKQSVKSNTATITTSPSGIWVVDPDRDLKFVLSGTGVDDWAMSDQETQYRTVGGDSVIKTTTGMYGLAGTFSGTLRDRPDQGLTLAGMRDDLYAIKEHPEATVRLIAGDFSIPVVLSDLSLAPHPESTIPAPRKRVSFRFVQDGDLPYEVRL